MQMEWSTLNGEQMKIVFNCVKDAFSFKWSILNWSLILVNIALWIKLTSNAHVSSVNLSWFECILRKKNCVYLFTEYISKGTRSLSIFIIYFFFYYYLNHVTLLSLFQSLNVNLFICYIEAWIWKYDFTIWAGKGVQCKYN